jgi:hypothetical protein
VRTPGRRGDRRPRGCQTGLGHAAFREARVVNPGGEFYALAHVSAGIEPGMFFSYHGRHPMQHRTRNNFSAVATSAGLIRPATMAGDHGHPCYRVLAFAPNQACRDFTGNFGRAGDQQPGRPPAAPVSA